MVYIDIVKPHGMIANNCLARLRRTGIMVFPFEDFRPAVLI
jgi:hypothetical protein